MEAPAACRPPVELFTEELSAMQALLRQQTAILAAADFNRLMSTQVVAFCRKAKLLKALTAPEVSTLTLKIQEGPWTTEQQGELVLAVSSALYSRIDAASPAKGEVRHSQDISTMQEYYSQHDIDIISNHEMSWKARIDAAVNRMHHMGLVGTSEQSKKHIFSTLLAAFYSSGLPEVKAMPEEDIRVLFVQFREAVQKKFKNRRDPGAVGYIVNWPAKPSMLQQTTLDLIYENGPPVSLGIPETLLKQCSDSIWVRGNANAVRRSGSALAISPQARRPASPQTTQPPMVDMGQMMQQMMGHMMQQMVGHMVQQGQGGPQRPEINIQFAGADRRPSDAASAGHQPAMSASAPNLCLHDGPTPAPMPATVPRAPLKVEPPASLLGTQGENEMSPEEQAAAFMASLKGANDDNKHKGTEDDKAKDGKGKDDKKGSQAKGKAKAKAKATCKAKDNSSTKMKAKGKEVVKAKTKSGPKKPLRTQIPGWPDAKRLKLYPKGCPKCAWNTPGCTPSCFKQRGQL